MQLSPSKPSHIDLGLDDLDQLLDGGDAELRAKATERGELLVGEAHTPFDFRPQDLIFSLQEPNLPGELSAR